jgi:hypothetical protein
MKKSNKGITSEEFDKRFDAGEDMGDYLDLTKAKVSRKTQRVNIDFPASLLSQLDKEARRIGVARTALIKVWLAERLEHA